MRRISLALVVLACACSSKSKTPSESTDVDAGEDAAPLADAGPRVNDHGIILDFDTKKPLKGVTVSEGDVSTTTDDTGAWSLQAPMNTPLTLLTGQSLPPFLPNTRPPSEVGIADVEPQASTRL